LAELHRGGARRDRGAGRVEAEWVQEMRLREALSAIERDPSVVGVFLWKWFPEPAPRGQDFQLATPSIRRVIRDAWGAGRG